MTLFRNKSIYSNILWVKKVKKILFFILFNITFPYECTGFMWKKRDKGIHYS